MKIIEALKQIKDLNRKLDDLRMKISKHSAYLSTETPVYPDQKKQVREWLQAYSDIVAEVLRLRIAIQRTNLETKVVIEMDGKGIEKTIAEWIHRRRDLASFETNAWASLTDRGLREGTVKQSTEQVVEQKIVRCYDPQERDNKLNIFQSEPMIIDSKLEVINAITDLIEK